MTRNPNAFVASTDPNWLAQLLNDLLAAFQLDAVAPFSSHDSVPAVASAFARKYAQSRVNLSGTGDTLDVSRSAVLLAFVQAMGLARGRPVL